MADTKGIAGMSTIAARANLDDLLRMPGKAELIGGRIIPIMPTGDLPSSVAEEIFISLRNHVKSTGRGIAKADGVGYAVPELPSGRESFSPDASYTDGPRPKDPMRYFDGPPRLAVEVRSESDYGFDAENEMAAKREDYFGAGTLVVWDVDPIHHVVNCYRSTDPINPLTFRIGDVAEAEPAVPGWRMAVSDMFP